MAPSYTAAGIVNTITGEAGVLAPNTPVSIIGTDLAYGIHALTPDDLENDTLPTVFLSESVRVYVGRVPAYLTSVSPTQITLLVPGTLRPGPVKVQVVREGVAGPAVEVNLLDVAPSVFSLEGLATAAHEDWSLVSPDAPARGGEVLQFYAGGLGPTAAQFPDGAMLTPPLPPEITDRSLRIARISELRILLNGEEIPGDRILYAGRTAGIAGVYQILVRLPDEIPADPEIRIGLGEQLSPAGVKLPAYATPGDSGAFIGATFNPRAALN